MGHLQTQVHLQNPQNAHTCEVGWCWHARRAWVHHACTATLANVLKCAVLFAFPCNPATLLLELLIPSKEQTTCCFR